MFVDLKTLFSIAALLATLSSSNGAETRTDRTSRRRSATSTSKKMKSTSKTTSTTTTTLSPVTEILVSETTLSLRLSESDITETNLTSSDLITATVSASTEPITTPILTTSTVAEVEVASTIQIVETTSTEPSTVTVSSTPRRTVPTRASTIKLITTESSRRSSTRQQSTAKSTNKIKGTVNSVPLVYSSFSQNQNDECVFDRYMNCSSDEPVICYGHGPIECTNNYTRSRRNSSKSRFNCIMAPTLKCTANIMNCSGKAMCQLDDETADSDGQASRPVASIQKLPSYKEGGHDGQHPEPLTYSEMAIITVLSALGVLVLASVALAAYLSYSKIKIGPEIRITNSRGEDRRI